MAAVALGSLRPELFDEACFRRPELSGDAGRVSLQASDKFTRAYPDHYGARVTLVLEDDRTVSHAVRDSLGDTECPVGEPTLFDDSGASTLSAQERRSVEA